MNANCDGNCLAYVWEHLHNFKTRRIYFKHQTPPPPLIRVALNAFSFADVRPNKEIYGHGTPYRVDSYTFTVDSHVQILSTEYSGP